MELVDVVASVRKQLKHIPNTADVTLMDLDPGWAELKRFGNPQSGLSHLYHRSSTTNGRACTQALRAGARGSITKDRLNEDLVLLVRECVRRSS